MKQIVCALVLIHLLASAVMGQPLASFIVKIYGPGGAETTSVVADLNDNHFYVMTQSNTYTNPNTNASTAGVGGVDVWLSKVQSVDGNMVWFINLGSSMNDNVGGLTLDRTTGGLYATVLFLTSAGSLDGLSVTSDSTTQYANYIARINPADGTRVWRTISSGSKMSFMLRSRPVLLGQFLYVYAELSVSGSTTYRGTAFSAKSSSGFVAAFFKENGTFARFATWCTTTGCTILTKQIASDGNDILYCIGDTSTAFDGQTSSGGQDMFMTRFVASNLTRLGTKFIGSSVSDTSYDVTYSSRHSAVYVSGLAAGAIGTNNLMGSGSDAALIKLTPTGVISWARLLGGASTDQGFAIAQHPFTGLVYLAGSTTSASILGTNNLGTTDVIIGVYDSSGNRGAFKMFGAASAEYITSIGFTANGRLIAAGRWGSPAVFVCPSGNY